MLDNTYDLGDNRCLFSHKHSNVGLRTFHSHNVNDNTLSLMERVDS